MNVLFVMYGHFGTNSAHPMALHARELGRLGHECVAAVPSGLESLEHVEDPQFRPVLYAEALGQPAALFTDGRPADIVHAWTPREGVRRFVTAYLAKQPTPWIMYLEDNEAWIARAALAMVGIPEDVLLQHTDEVISTWTPEGIPHALHYRDFIGLSDAVVVIQDKLRADVAPWLDCTTVMPGVDLERFAPRPRDAGLRERYGVGEHDRVVVYPGGLNDFTRPGLEALSRAVGLVNEAGVACKLLRSGPVPIDFRDRLPPAAAAAVIDLGPLPRAEIPALLSLADVFVQPGKPDPFEDLRLPGKLPELFATGRPVVLPNTNIASLLRDGVDAVIHETGAPEEMAAKCLELFANPDRARAIGEGGRRFAETHFDPRRQARELEAVYERTISAFDRACAQQLWDGEAERTPVSLLLVKRLRLLARSGAKATAEAASMLRAHADAAETAFERARGLEAGMAVRDREIASLKALLQVSPEEVAVLRGAVTDRDQRIHALESSLSWRLTKPLRAVTDLVARAFSRGRR